MYAKTGFNSVAHFGVLWRPVGENLLSDAFLTGLVSRKRTPAALVCGDTPPTEIH